MITLDELDEVFDQHFTRTAFRLETLDEFDVATDGDEVARYLDGCEPDTEFKEQFLAELREERVAGKLRHRVRVFHGPLTDYLRYECEWGYGPNVEAGEVIRILDLTERARPTELVDEEFWLLDDEIALVMHYDAGGAFLGATLADEVEPYRRARDAAIEASTDFTTWWSRHPEHWRANRQRKDHDAS